MQKLIEQTALALARSKSNVVLSGAGMSAESGIPTFRGNKGLWKEFNAQELATPQALRKNFSLVWQWYNERKKQIAEKSPNAGHLALSRLQEIIPLAIITQNIDNLHSRAGSSNVLEIHGNIFKARCMACGHVMDFSQTDNSTFLCPACTRGKLRPHVVLFGERLDERQLQKTFALLQSAQVFLVIGTSSMVYPAASFAEIAAEAGALIVEINPQPTAQADIVLRGKSGEILPQILQSLQDFKSLKN